MIIIQWKQMQWKKRKINNLHNIKIMTHLSNHRLSGTRFTKPFFNDKWRGKNSDKSADNQSEARISLANYNKNCHLSLMTSFVNWVPSAYYHWYIAIIFCSNIEGLIIDVCMYIQYTQMHDEFPCITYAGIEMMITLYSTITVLFLPQNVSSNTCTGRKRFSSVVI